MVGQDQSATGNEAASLDELESLMVRYQQGDLQAFEGLFATLSVPIRNYLTSMTRDRSRGEDLMQETFLQMHRSRQTHEPGRPVKPWAFGIARHVFLMDRRSRLRRAKRERTPDEDLPEIPVAGLAEMFPDREDLTRALLEVPDNRRESLLLHHVWGFSFREVGNMLGITERAAKLRAFRGMQNLREMLDVKGTRS